MTGQRSPRESGSTPEPTTNGTSQAAAYTAVVYVHGIGEQQRYEPVSQLLHYLEKFASLCNLNLHYNLDVERIKRDSLDSTIQHDRDKVAAYQTLDWSDDSANSVPGVRFYEAYWAHHAVEGTNAFSVLRWVVSQADKPRAVRRAPWSALSLLRLSTLIGIYETLQQEREGTQRQRPDQPPRPIDDPQLNLVFERLVEQYTEFSQGAVPEHVPYRPAVRWQGVLRWIARLRRIPFTQSFYGFYVMLQMKGVAADDNRNEALRRLALRWWVTHGLEQLRYQFIIGTLWVTLALIVAIGLVVAFSLPLSVAVLLNAVFRAQGPFSLPSANVVYLLASALIGVLLLIIFTQMRAPLKTYLGDVQQYVTYQETDEKYRRRRAIQQEVIALLQHVIQSPGCQRVVIIAHSLGSVIAYDAILGLQRLARSYKPNSAEGQELNQGLMKITNLITMGSPIDKIAYFFNAIQSQYPRYVHLVHRLRGDMQSPPFIHPNGQPQIAWTNYWDKGDPISGAIQNVVGSDFLRQRVQNIQVTSYGLPIPDRNHAGYFQHMHVLRDMLMIIQPTIPLPADLQPKAEVPPVSRRDRPSSVMRRWSRQLLTSLTITVLPGMLAILLTWMSFRLWAVLSQTMLVSLFFSKIRFLHLDTPGLLNALIIFAVAVVLGGIIVTIWKMATHSASIEDYRPPKSRSVDDDNDRPQPGSGTAANQTDQERTIRPEEETAQ